MLSGLNIEEYGCRHYDVPSLKRKEKEKVSHFLKWLPDQ